MAYRCVATSVAGFVQQLAVAYVARGYCFYVTGWIPEGKDPVEIDQKLITRYGVEPSQWKRCRHRKLGLANVQYLRYGRFFVLIADHGQHDFFEREGRQIRDIRKQPILFHGYSIGYRRSRGDGTYHASVRIERRTLKELKRRLLRVAVHRSVDELSRLLYNAPFEPYAPVRDQIRIILRAINRKRHLAGLEIVPWNAPRFNRASLQPFGNTLRLTTKTAASLQPVD